MVETVRESREVAVPYQYGAALGLDDALPTTEYLSLAEIQDVRLVNQYLRQKSRFYVVSMMVSIKVSSQRYQHFTFANSCSN